MSLLLQNRIRRNSRNRYGKRTERLITFNDGQKRKSGWVYDKYGRLTAMNDEGKTVSYTYDNQSRISVRKADNIPVYYTYTRFGQLETKSLGSPFAFSADSKPIAYIKYFYGSDGQITARDVSGNKQEYKYDLKGQLLAVVDATGKAVEQYVYDAAGNILSKAIDGKVTTFKYDKANQLVSSIDGNGKVTHYDYDAAGRLTKEGDKSYAYGWLDKVMNVSENGKLAASYDYGVDGQISGRTDAAGKSESFTWDGLALIKRNSTNFLNESAVTGGNPILAFGKDSSKVLFEDMLGSSMGSVENGKFNAIDRSAFGESKTDSELNFFTGKPQVEGLGYAFNLRNYRAEQGKWQTQDPIGYPDGWNNLAYCINRPTQSIDIQGQWTLQIGFSFTGGGGNGGTVESGIALSYSAATGFSWGSYTTTGGGAYIGAGGSVTLNVTGSTNQTISALQGLSTEIGASGGEAITGGGAACIPIGSNASTSYSVSIGAGGGVPFEQHTFIAYTFITQLNNNGSTVSNITSHPE